MMMKLAAGTLPKKTALALAKLIPVMTTDVPPALVPVLVLELAAVLVIGAVAAWETYARPPLAGVSAPVT